MKRLGHRVFGLVLAALLLYGGMLPPVRGFFSLPWMLRQSTTSPFNLSWELPPGLARQVEIQAASLDKASTDGQEQPGWWQLQLKLFGVIPLKNITVQMVQPVSVFPGGQSIGVLLKTEGVMVVGQAAVIDARGNKFYPAQKAGLETGDTILAIDGQEVSSDQEVASLIDAAGRGNRPLRLTVRRGERLLSIDIQPVYCQETGRYRIGVFIRDSTAGVGTLTFYDRDKNIFGALGHMVSGDGQEKINLSGGRIVAAAIQGIHQGRRGQPGEKIGVFLENSKFSGIIQKNTTVGIFGTITGDIPGYFTSPLPVALAETVRPGPAEILTVVEGEKVERFQVEIERVMLNQRASGRGLIIRITDPRLLALTGGIIQGMSGSPIIQEGQLVGAVTHVFINDPARGYGVLAEWMLQETELVASARGLPSNPLVAYI
ncbi:SpoIVB peptidase [Moorella sulfitireducens (nom. illeg.)]|uniref:SpoIVB peptidase n=1 Tax=Neomoorella sulfitireducens TaxID=2972948 RepID=UPI0021ACE218|nr:SpoIVB peptidase [Moorella sulfitireducens]